MRVQCTARRGAGPRAPVRRGPRGWLGGAFLGRCWVGLGGGPGGARAGCGAVRGTCLAWGCGAARVGGPLLVPPGLGRVGVPLPRSPPRLPASGPPPPGACFLGHAVAPRVARVQAVFEVCAPLSCAVRAACLARFSPVSTLHGFQAAGVVQELVSLTAARRKIIKKTAQTPRKH